MVRVRKMITTKKGSRNSQVSVTVNSSTRFENVLKLPDFQNDYAQGSYGKYNVKMLNGWGPKISSVQDPVHEVTSEQPFRFPGPFS